MTALFQSTKTRPEFNVTAQISTRRFTGPVPRLTHYSYDVVTSRDADGNYRQARVFYMDLDWLWFGLHIDNERS